MNQQTETRITSEILAVEEVTHDVRRIVVEKPDGFEFKAGQATNVSVDRDGWRDKKRPFTFTSLVSDANLEFTIKIYPARDGVTDEIGDLTPGDRLILREPWGAITYRGPGTFIAGGAGVTPFIAILRQLESGGIGSNGSALKDSHLIFSNKTAEDIILEAEFTRMLGERGAFTLTREEHGGYLHGRINREMIKRHHAGIDRPFYVCGPPGMVQDVCGMLKAMGVDADRTVIEE